MAKELPFPGTPEEHSIRNTFPDQPIHTPSTSGLSGQDKIIREERVKAKWRWRKIRRATTKLMNVDFPNRFAKKSIPATAR